jgi:hypothetical protein
MLFHGRTQIECPDDVEILQRRGDSTTSIREKTFYGRILIREKAPSSALHILTPGLDTKLHSFDLVQKEVLEVIDVRCAQE